MVGRVPPLGEVNLGEDAVLAGHPGVDLVVWEDHGVHLDVVDFVGAVAEDPRQLGLPDLGQLLQGETAGPAAVLVPEPVAQPEVVELLADDAGEGWAHHGARQRAL